MYIACPNLISDGRKRLAKALVDNKAHIRANISDNVTAVVVSNSILQTDLK